MLLEGGRVPGRGAEASGKRGGGSPEKGQGAAAAMEQNVQFKLLDDVAPCASVVGRPGGG